MADSIDPPSAVSVLGPRSVAVLGSGSWGTALANHLQLAGHNVTLWGRDASVLEEIRTKHRNPKYVRGLQLAEGLTTSADAAIALKGAHLAVVAIPSDAVRSVIQEIKPLVGPELLVVSGIKGLEIVSLKTATEILSEELGFAERIGVLGGPSFAAEVVQGLPTAMTLAAPSVEKAEQMRRFFHFKNLRVYTSTDVIGVEIGGAAKNVIALATGIIDGVGMGQNARAALITRGLVEIQQISSALGADPRTIGGLSGLGDLLLTAVGDLSRNRQVGLRLGRGEKLEHIVASLGQVAEGVHTTSLLLALARRHNVQVPIIEQVDRVITGKSEVSQAVQALLAREPSSEL